MQEFFLKYDSKNTAVATSETSKEAVTERPKSPTEDDFETVKLISNGAYG